MLYPSSAGISLLPGPLTLTHHLYSRVTGCRSMSCWAQVALISQNTRRIVLAQDFFFNSQVVVPCGQAEKGWEPGWEPWE